MHGKYVTHGQTTITRHGVTKNSENKDEKHTGKLIRKKPKTIDAYQL